MGLADLILDLSADCGVLCEIHLRVLASLSDLVPLIRVPGAALFDHPRLRSQIDHIAFPGDAGPEHDIEFRFLEGRGHLVLDDLDAHMVADGLAALLQSLRLADVKPYG